MSGSTVFVGGQFTAIDGESRHGLAALDRRTGTVIDWNPNPGLDTEDSDDQPLVFALAATGTTLYVGGRFTAIGGRQRTNIATVGASTGAATSWRPGADQDVETIAVSRSTIYAGGDFDSVGGWERSHLAVLDTHKGTFTTTPQTNGSVDALAHLGSRVYVGGAFTRIGDRARHHIAAITTKTGAITAWNPNSNDTIYALAVAGPRIYAGGAFTRIGGAARSRIAALDAVGGAATGWNPGANRAVKALARSGSRVYAGGTFTRIAHRARRYIAALDAATSIASAWNPHPHFRGDCSPYADTPGCEIGPGILALAVSGSTLYAGGVFTSIGGKPRSYLTALDTTHGSATAWNPNPYAVTYALAVSSSTIFAGTDNGVTAFSLRTGLPSPWKPDIESVHALTISNSRTYAGGSIPTEADYPTWICGFRDSPRTTGTTDRARLTRPPLYSHALLSINAPRISTKLDAPADEAPTRTLIRPASGDSKSAAASSMHRHRDPPGPSAARHPSHHRAPGKPSSGRVSMIGRSDRRGHELDRRQMIWSPAVAPASSASRS